MKHALTALAAGLALTAPAFAQDTAIARFDWFAYEGADPEHAVVQPGPGQFRNPILSGFYPDPSNTRAGEDYYLVTSTFAYFPGLPVFHSRDLVNWTQIGNAIDRPDQVDFGTLGLSRGLFAPTIEHHAGTFYILNTCVDCGDNFVITATDPAGPWSDPVWLPDLAGGIDPALFIDEDGSAWILNNGPPDREPEYDGHRAIWIQRFGLETLSTHGPRTLLVDGGVDFSTRPIWIEGPHIYKVDGRYVLTAAEGGTAEAHSQVALVADRPDGPYTPAPDNPFLTQRDLPRDRDFPITSAGHADLVQTPDGDWWATFLAVRPYGEDFYNTGRETFLMPVTWENGWPRITAPGEVIPHVMDRPDLPQQPAPDLPTTGPFSVTEDFDGETLPVHWLTVRNPRSDWFSVADGALHLTARPQGLGDMANPSFAARRQQHMTAAASTEVRFTPAHDGDRAGLAAFQSDDFWWFIGVGRHEGQDVVLVERRAGPDDPARGVIVAAAPLPTRPGEPLRLRASVDVGEIDLAFAAPDGEWTPLVEDGDASILSTRTAGGFVGSVFGAYAYSPAGPAD
ncbi:glycoside hydrolase family 43 protein [Brevundimonas sp.]|uniref:glycoside hydrolase family 43 protein n=1 Tax=Brevundimonas sp. TaxID=1871086 RepID=UPI0039E68173